MVPRTKVEDQVWGQEVAYWDYLKNGDWNANLSLWHERASAWFNAPPGPLGKQGIRQMWADMALHFRPGSISVELKPLSVEVYGDVAVVNYEYLAEASRQDGTRSTMQHRITHTWLHTENGWKIIGGMSVSSART